MDVVDAVQNEQLGVFCSHMHVTTRPFGAVGGVPEMGKLLKECVYWVVRVHNNCNCGKVVELQRSTNCFVSMWYQCFGNIIDRVSVVLNVVLNSDRGGVGWGSQLARFCAGRKMQSWWRFKNGLQFVEWVDTSRRFNIRCGCFEHL